MKQKLLNSIRLRLLMLLAVLVSGINAAWGDEVTVTKAISAIATANSWTTSSGSNVTCYTSFDLDENITISTTGTGNCGSYWSDGWRLYQTASGNVTVTASNNCTLVSVTYTYTVSNSGTLKDGSTTISSGTKKFISGTSKTYTVGNTSTKTNGQVRINQISVTYNAPAAKTDPTITFNNGSVRVGQDLDLSTLFTSNSAGAVTYSITSGGSYASIDGSTLTGTAVGNVVVTASQAAAGDYNAGEAAATITVNAAKTLSSIAVTTTPTKTSYYVGETFDNTGMVVTATYSDASTEDVTASCVFSPTSALTTDVTEVTISYTENAVEKTTTQAITVNEIPAYTVTFNAGTGSCATASLTEASAKAGVTLPTATIGVAGWSFAGWATASTASTEVEPTLYAAGDTYYPVDNCTLYAVYKFSEASATSYKRATSVSDITSATSVVIVCNNQNKVLDNTLDSGVNAPTETSSKITAPADAIFTLTGDNEDGYTLTNSTTTVGASSTDNSTVISNTTTNDLWVVKAHNTANTFYFENKGKENLSLEYYNSSGYKWMVYAPGTPSTNAALAMKVYVPVTTTVYNSNPAAIVNPTIAWTTSGDKTLYLQNTSTYTNAANVTGISKTPVYTSSDATVASVSEAGVVTGLKAGETTITATVEAEAGVNTMAEASYVVTVKDASDIAGIKAITSTSTVVAFTADLTDAVVTYVNGNHAYIQDASGAIYASCGSSLTAGKKINGAVSGSVKAANQIDEITAIDLSGATITDGVIPSATVITAATLAANGANYEGKLVSIEGATVTASLENGKASGGKISDDGKTTEINLYAPDSNIEALKDAEGTFNGYISLYNGSTIRFNIYEQSQITLTKNAPTDQSLSFASDAVELDEETSAYDEFAGQTVSGAVGDVTYTIYSDESSVVTSIDSETGAVVLSGNIGTATIKASAAAKEVTEAGVTTPYKATTKTYTITVYPRYTVTFSANGVETPVRQASHGAAVEVPSPSDLSGFNFVGWSATTVDLTDDAPSMESLGATVTPEADATYYAVFAVQGIGEDEDFEFYKNTGSAETDATSGITAAGNINTTSSNGNPGDSFGLTSQSNKTATFTGIDISKEKSASLKLDYKLAKSGSNYSSLAVTQYDSEDNVLGSPTEITGSDQIYHTSGTIALNTACVKITIVCSPAGSTYNTFVDNVIITVPRPSVSYGSYCTTVPAHVNISSTVGYTTYVATDNVSFPGDVTAYIATQVNAETISLKEVLAVPEGTAVVVKGDKGVYMLDVEDAGDCDDVSGNLLQASDGFVEGDDKTIFALGVGKVAPYEGVVGFYLVNDGQKVPAGKAYLEVAAPGPGVKGFTFNFDIVTGVNAIAKSQEPRVNGQIFNLAGQKMSKLQKGVNIVNGKKVLVK